MMEPRRGSLAYCSVGLLGLITSDRAELIEYPDGNKAYAWTGIQLTSSREAIGTSWSSRTPRVVGHIDDLTREIRVEDATPKKRAYYEDPGPFSLPMLIDWLRGLANEWEKILREMRDPN